MVKKTTCDVCGQLFEPRHANQIYCTAACRKVEHDKRCREANPERSSRLGTRASGAVSELVVCADLLRRGYEVFRSVSQECSCDLIALKDGVSHRVEVRTTYRNFNGKMAKTPLVCKDGKYDLAVLVCGHELMYIPPLDRDTSEAA